MKKPQQIVIMRTKQDEHQTSGTLELFDSNGKLFECLTLELPWRNNQQRISRIPDNHYKAVKHQSPKFGNTIWIQDVPNRSEILIHRGNYRRDTLGCILVGEKLIDIDGDGHKDVTNSTATMNKLYELVKDPVYVNIIDNY